MVRGPELYCSLTKRGVHASLEGPRPFDSDQQGNPISMNAQERNVFNDNITFSDLMKACRLNTKVKTSRKQVSATQR